MYALTEVASRLAENQGNRKLTGEARGTFGPSGCVRFFASQSHKMAHLGERRRVSPSVREARRCRRICARVPVQ